MKKPPTSVDSSDKKKGQKIHFFPEVVDVPKKPLTRDIAKKFPMEKTPKKPAEVLYNILENLDSNDKDKDIGEL